MRVKQDTQDLVSAFRSARSQCQIAVEEPKQKFNRGYDNDKIKKASSDKYLEFKDKYERLSETVDSFNTRDLMYYFREKANENGFKYVISNMQRDMGIFKKLQQSYSPREICLMIEFIYTSNQNYLEKDRTQPTVLASSWCNTLYRDSLLWADDNYVPRAKKTVVSREWKEDSAENKAEIGGWE